MRELKVGENEAGQRLDKLLAKYLNEAPKGFLYKMLRKKNITLNGRKAGGNEMLSVGDSVKFFLAEETIEKFSKSSVVKTTGRLDIIYEDEHVLLINKPAGMLSQKAKETDESVVEHVISYLLSNGSLSEEELRSFKPSVCNRLDRNTTGLIAAGKSLQGLQQMGQLFKERSLRKFYRCLVAGTIENEQHICGWIKKDETTNRVTVSETEVKDSLPIETSYFPIRRLNQTTLLEVHLITGRTHQIRAHLAAEGHPVIGDYKYGSKAVNDQFRQAYGLKSQLLHAYRLEFPECGGALFSLGGREFIAPLPDKFLEIIEKESRK